MQKSLNLAFTFSSLRMLKCLKSSAFFDPVVGWFVDLLALAIRCPALLGLQLGPHGQRVR